MSLNPTPARLALVRAIAAGQVRYLRRWGRDPDEVKWDRKTVTGAYRQLDEARPRLVELGPAEHPSMYAPKPVQLTEDGRAWLAAHDNQGATA